MVPLQFDPSRYSLNPNDYGHPSREQMEIFGHSVKTLIGVQLPILQIPEKTLVAFEPSQIGTITGTLMDACIPQLGEIIRDDNLGASRETDCFGHGLTKADGILGEREGYPDYEHKLSGLRTELKLLYVEPNINITMKTPPTPREPSARLTQKVTLKNVRPTEDMLLLIAYQFQERRDDPSLVSPTIVDVGIFPVIDCILARDKRLIVGGGRWFGYFETPVVLSGIGAAKLKRNEPLDDSTYGRKASEGRDFNEDTNFGKLNRIPLPSLVQFLEKHQRSNPQTYV